MSTLKSLEAQIGALANVVSKLVGVPVGVPAAPAASVQTAFHLTPKAPLVVAGKARKADQPRRDYSITGPCETQAGWPAVSFRAAAGYDSKIASDQILYILKHAARLEALILAQYR